MKDHDIFERLREIRWRGELSPAEAAELAAWLKQNPSRRADWDAEAALSQLLKAQPDVPVASNFTARVLHEAQKPQYHRTRSWLPRWLGSGRIWLPRLAIGSVAVVVGVFTYGQFQMRQRTNLVQGVSTVAVIAALPGPEILRDFDAIQALEKAPVADDELLRLME
jgi:anti-sigma factor RsiW